MRKHTAEGAALFRPTGFEHVPMILWRNTRLFCKDVAGYRSPMLFLSGIFFPTTQLPPLVRSIAEWLPLTAAVELVRPLFMDQWPAHPWRHAGVLAVVTVVAFWLALALTRKRFRN